MLNVETMEGEAQTVYCEARLIREGELVMTLDIIQVAIGKVWTCYLPAVDTLR